MGQAACDVMVIEDDTDIRTTLESVLADEGYSVVTAAHGKEGLERLENGCRPSLILLDMMMPVMDGEQFLTRYRQDARQKSPVVVVSAATRRSVEGATATLRKPIDLDNLFDVVRQYCGPTPHGAPA